MDDEAVREFVEQARATLESSPQMDEETTIFRLIIPFIKLLGWNTRSTEVEPEYTVRMGTGIKKVDFALLIGETPVVFIEAKAAASDLDDDSFKQLRSYMRQELDVDWGVITNGRSFEVLTKGNDGSQGEISLIQFDLDDLEKEPDLLDIISKKYIQSGKSDEIATQITQTNKAITHLQSNKEQVASKLDEVLSDEIGTSVPLDTEAQTVEFVEELISVLDDQRRAIGRTSTAGEAESSSPPARNGDEEREGEYIIKIQNDGETLATFADDNQSKVMAEAVNYLIENHELISEISPLPYVPGRKNAIVNDEPLHPDGEREMGLYKELTDGYYLDTHTNKEQKRRRMANLTKECGLSVDFTGGW